ncbi:MAG TPA: APC family permease, partial [Terracidiphilus sp.]|nr:APC family permease [Terracidiphilus sp.]
NLASLLRGWRHGRFKQWFPMLLSLGGMLTCLFLWINLGTLARIAGTCWALAGILLWVVRRRYTTLPGEAA